MRRLRIAIGVSTITLTALAATAPIEAQQIEFADWAVAARTYMLPDELERLASVTTMEQAQQLMEIFWERRTPAGGEQAGFRRTFNERLAYAEKEFAEADRQGSLTPRGQIWLLLGQPTRSGTTFRRFRVGAELRPLEVWEYDRDGSRRRTLRFVFAHTRAGVKFVVENPLVGLPPDLREGLAEARAAFVKQPLDLPSVTVDDAGGSLELGGTVVRHQGTLVARLAVDPRQLLGEPRSDGIVFRLRLEIDDTQGDGRAIGTIHVPMTPEMLAEGAAAEVRIIGAFSAPETVRAIRVVEPLSGRETRLPVEAAESLPDPEDVARFLSIASLGADGVAYAYLGPCAIAPAVARLAPVAHGLVAQTSNAPRGTRVKIVRLVAAHE